jgi:YEATS domain-containing protein 4
LTESASFGTFSCGRFHHLKLYPEDDSGPQNTKKPVVVESYDEIVFTDPSDAFFDRIKNYPIVSVNGSPIPASSSPPVASGEPANLYNKMATGSICPFIVLNAVLKSEVVIVMRAFCCYAVSNPAAGGEVESKRGDTKDHPLAQWFFKHSDAEELASLKAARSQVCWSYAFITIQVNISEGILD